MLWTVLAITQGTQREVVGRTMMEPHQLINKELSRLSSVHYTSCYESIKGNTAGVSTRELKKGQNRLGNCNVLCIQAIPIGSMASQPLSQTVKGHYHPAWKPLPRHYFKMKPSFGLTSIFCPLKSLLPFLFHIPVALLISSSWPSVITE